MKTAIAVGVISLAVLCLSPLTQAQYMYQSPYAQPAQIYTPQQSTQWFNTYANQNPWEAVANQQNQLAQWGQQWQQNFQQQQLYNDYQWQQYQYQHQQAQWLKPYQVSPYSYNEPEVYAPRVAIPGGDVLLEPGDDQ